MTHEAGIEAAYRNFVERKASGNPPEKGLLEDAIQAYLSASGMVLVPREPTEEMVEMGEEVNSGQRHVNPYIYHAMRNAAPNPFRSQP